jgi:hypothetical protein
MVHTSLESLTMDDKRAKEELTGNLQQTKIEKKSKIIN